MRHNIRHPWALVLGLCLWLGLSGVAQAKETDKHVRVVYDTSGTMTGLDKDRLAALSVLLLSDLVDVKDKDSFKVYPFGLEEASWDWQDPTKGCGDRPTFHDKLPVYKKGGTTVEGALEYDSTQSYEVFHKEFDALVQAYDSPWTYFLPGLEAAVEDLGKVPTSKDSKEVIVLVTDGLPSRRSSMPEFQDSVDEWDCIQKAGVLDTIKKEGIDFYVLAFGDEATTESGFFVDLVTGAGGDKKRFKPDKDGKGLSSQMADIFAESFGYQKVPVMGNKAPYRAELAHGGVSEGRTYVVGVEKSKDPPSLELKEPSSGSAAPSPAWGVDGRHSRLTKGKWSYRITGEDGPDPGLYEIETNADDGVIVLRPASYRLEWEQDFPLNVVGGMDHELALKVYPKGGGAESAMTKGVTVQWRLHYGDLKPAMESKVEVGNSPWQGTLGSPVSTWQNVKKTNSDKQYVLKLEDDRLFPDLRGPSDNWTDPPTAYPAFIEIRILSDDGGGVVELAPKPYPVTVMPFVGFRVLTLGQEKKPHVPADQASLMLTEEGDAFQSWPDGDEVCFGLRVESLGAPHPETGEQVPLEGPTYTSSHTGELYFTFELGSLENTKTGDSADQAFALNGPLNRRTRFTLEGEPLQRAGDTASTNSDWILGQKPWDVDGDETKEFCIWPGMFNEKETVEAELNLIAGLKGLPPAYGGAPDVWVDDFRLTIQAEPQGFMAKWATLLTLLLLLLLALLGLWYLRYRPDIPGDLRLAMGPKENLQPTALGDPVFWRRVLALRPRYPVHTAQGDQELGTLIPIDRELYLFKAVGEVRISRMDGRAMEQDEEGHLLEAGRLYHVQGPGYRKWMRVEYE